MSNPVEHATHVEHAADCQSTAKALTHGTPQASMVGSAVATTSSTKKAGSGSGKGGFATVKWMRRVDNGEVESKHAHAFPGGVPMKEVRQHNEKGDRWVILDGHVYDISEYEEYHPGGASQIARAGGADATQLFYANHSWVNYRELLEPCYVGPLL